MSVIESSNAVYGPYLNFRSAHRETNSYSFSSMFVTKGVDYRINSTLISEAGFAVSLANAKEIYQEGDVKFYRMEFSILRDLNERKITLATKVGENWKNVEVTIPGTTTPIRFPYFSCNGFDDPSKSAEMGGIQPMWRDINSKHNEQPLHILLGGGDQLYCDTIWDLPTISAWRAISHEHHRFAHAFTPEMAEEVNNFYLKRYLEHFNEPEFREALGKMPGIFTWDDHDIFDGWGSYHPDENNCPVFQGIFEIAKKWYLIFQHQMLPAEAADLGYFGNSSYHTIKEIDDVAILSIDARSRRTYTQIVAPEDYQTIFEKLANLSDDIKHLLVMFSVPLKYADFKYVGQALEFADKINISENVRKLLNKPPSDRARKRGTDHVDLLDDLGDHPQNPRHIVERNQFIESLQQFAEEKGVRVTLISGDVHLAAQGYFASSHDVAPEHDPKHMVQFVSSAVANITPTKLLVHLMNPQVGKVEKVNNFTIAKLTEWEAEDKSESRAFVLHRNWLLIQRNPQGLFVRLNAEDEKKSEDRKLVTVTKTYVKVIPDLILQPEVAAKEHSKYTCALI